MKCWFNLILWLHIIHSPEARKVNQRVWAACGWGAILVSLRLELLRRAGGGSCAPSSLAFYSTAEANVSRFAWGAVIPSAWSTVLCVSLALLSISISDVTFLESDLLGQESGCPGTGILKTRIMLLCMRVLFEASVVHKESGCSFWNSENRPNQKPFMKDLLARGSL